MARAATISAWVELSPPETPMHGVFDAGGLSRFASPCTWML